MNVQKQKSAEMGETRVVYHVIKFVFWVGANTFYSSFDVRGEENVPPEGEATLLCFNHGNSLTDSVVLIGRMPRVVRFCAKNTLWEMPFMNHFVRGSGAVPVYRRREHGDKAVEFNVATFSAVYDALENGNCVGFSPEGVSSFRSYHVKFKDGVGHIALQTVENAVKKGREDFTIKILPAVMAWTHREKFRSDVMLRFRPPVVVDKSWLEKYPTRKVAAKELVRLVEEEFHENMISAPNWKTIKLAITATRIQRPLGTFMSLSTYMYFLRGWVEIFKMDMTTEIPLEESRKLGSRVPQAQRPSMTIQDIWNTLDQYQSLLDLVKVKDERIRRVEITGQRPGFLGCIRIISYRLILCIILFAIAGPGLLIWSPIWFLIKRKERDLLDKGAGWVDSVAENKMLVGFLAVLTLIVLTNVFAPFVLMYLWLTMRLYEEAVASARSIFGIFRITMVSDDVLRQMIDLRKQAENDVLIGAALFPRSSAERIKEECGDNIYDNKTDEDINKRPRWWTNFDPMRRRKKDWNELLRLSDYCTMDYVE